MAWFNLYTIISVAFLAYIGHSIYSLYSIYHPPSCSKGPNCIRPLTLRDKDIKLQLRLYLSHQAAFRGKSSSHLEVARLENVDSTLDWDKDIEVKLPAQTRQNGSAWLHVFLLPQAGAVNLTDPYEAPWFHLRTVQMTTHMVPQAETFQLIGAAKNASIEESQQNATDRNKPGKGSSKDEIAAKRQTKPVTHWRSVLPVRISADPIVLDSSALPGELYHLIKINYPKKEYYPILFVDDLSFRIRDLVEVKLTVENIALKIQFSTISLGKIRLLWVAQNSIQQLKGLGFSDKDTDEVKSIFTDTNFYFLALTFFVAAVHLLLDFLAIKNDVNFWRHRKTLIGLSARTVLWNCGSHCVIFVYLYDQETSLLVLIPAGAGVVIEIWKVVKMVGMRKRLGTDASLAQEESTESFDSQGMRYLYFLLVPLCLGGAAYSLLYVPHKSWSSWIIQCLANGVYAFGFLFMLPQLFINYKLKSVAHLPWRAFMYKAFNTFIDDMFAFIIKMPTAHRLACFRDDIVFVVYLYQRWLYPVDRTRVNEFGESFEDTKKLTAAEESKKKK